MKTLLLLSAALFLSVSGFARTPEASRAAAGSSFKVLSYPRFDPAAPGVPAAQGKPAEAPAAPAKSSPQFVTLSGNLNLNGSGMIPHNGGWTMVTLSGWTSVSDSSGKIRSNSEYVSVTGSFFVNGSWVNGTVWPNVYVSLYRDGRYLGQARVDGTIFVSGFASGGWVNLSGSGMLRGTISVQD